MCTNSHQSLNIEAIPQKSRSNDSKIDKTKPLSVEKEDRKEEFFVGQDRIVNVSSWFLINTLLLMRLPDGSTLRPDLHQRHTWNIHLSDLVLQHLVQPFRFAPLTEQG